MARYIVRRLMTMLLSMLLISIIVFAVVEIAPGNVARNILGAFATPEQERSMENQLGLDRPAIYPLPLLVVWLRLAGQPPDRYARQGNRQFPRVPRKSTANGGQSTRMATWSSGMWLMANC